MVILDEAMGEMLHETNIQLLLEGLEKAKTPLKYFSMGKGFEGEIGKIKKETENQE